MMFLVFKYAVTALLVVLISEVAKRADKPGAILAALPVTTLLVLIWLHLDGQPVEKIANHAYYTFWYVLPTLPMFLLVPVLLRHGVSFWASLAAGCVVTVGCFLAAAALLKPFRIELLP